MNIVNIQCINGKFIAEIIHFPIFYSMEYIVSGYIGLEIGTNYTQEYDILYPVTPKDTIKESIDEAISFIKDAHNPLSFWAGVFIEGKYSKKHTLLIDCDKAALILPEPLR